MDEFFTFWKSRVRVRRTKNEISRRRQATNEILTATTAKDLFTGILTSTSGKVQTRNYTVSISDRTSKSY